MFILLSEIVFLPSQIMDDHERSKKVDIINKIVF